MLTYTGTEQGVTFGELEADVDSISEVEWNNADKYFTVFGVDQAVFLDDNGKTERLLLRTLTNGQICADYRFSWDEDRVLAIERLNSKSETAIQHVFTFDEEGALFADMITTDYIVRYQDYDPATQKWSEHSEVMPDNNKIKNIFTDDIGNRETRDLHCSFRRNANRKSWDINGRKCFCPAPI